MFFEYLWKILNSSIILKSSKIVFALFFVHFWVVSVGNFNLPLLHFTLQVTYDKIKFETKTWKNIVLKHLCKIHLWNIKAHEKNKIHLKY